MDVHILIVIFCVFFASLLSLLFINKFFRRKTFEEIVAEKRAMKLLGQSRPTAASVSMKKSAKKEQQHLKKEQKKEKKQRQREQQQQQQREDDSDEQSEQLAATGEAQPRGLSKTHVEFDPDPIVVDEAALETSRRNSIAEKENALTKAKNKKDKRHNKAAGILINKNEPVAVKAPVAAAAEETLNHFDVKLPKDAFELKKEREKLEEPQQPVAAASTGKREKNSSKKDKAVANVEQPVEAKKELAVVAKDIKQQEVKARQGSPKTQQSQATQNGMHVTSAPKSKKNKQKESNNNNVISKELLHALDRIQDNETISVSLLMNIFRRAELNRSEIQILIDYLLNKQQDMPDTHSEWSDDVCLKLKRQLEESQRALAEEQEASMGLQAKLRELRAEVNAERIQSSSTVKACLEKVQSKEQEIAALNQEIQSLNEKFNVERQQFQSKLLREKQSGSQDLLAKLQRMQGEIAHKDNCISELTCMVNASRQAHEESQQKNDIIQNQAQQIRTLEQQRDELEQLSNNRLFELEKAKELETENAERKVEICNLQNALESSKADLAEARRELEAARSEQAHARSTELDDKQKQINEVLAKNVDLTQQLNALINSKDAEHAKEQTGLRATLDAVQSKLREKEQHLAEFNARNSELMQQQKLAAQQQDTQRQEMEKLVNSLKADLKSKHETLQTFEQNAERLAKREQELQHQLQEQKEKNNELRMKNWKLIEALQSAEARALKTTATDHTLSHNNSHSDSLKNQQNKSPGLVQQQQILFSATSAAAPSKQDEAPLRDLLKRLCPQAVEACASTALSLPLSQWIEQVLAVHAKQQQQQSPAAAAANQSTTTTATNTAVVSSSNKSTQSQALSNNHNSQSNSHVNSNSQVVNNNSSNNNNSSSSDNNGDAAAFNSFNKSNSNKNHDATEKASPELQELIAENAQLRTRNDELTKLVTKTSNTLSELERRALEQEEVWRNALHIKDDLIHSLQHSNGEQNP